jgi:hypothetical protein
MDKKTQQLPTQSKTKVPYRPPRLTAYGKLHKLVAAGSSGKSEGMSGSMNRRA